MSKLLEKMRNNPRDWSVVQVATLCTQVGLTCTAPSGGGSHYKISRSGIDAILTVPAARPIKPVYIRRLVAMADQAVALDALDDDEKKPKDRRK